MDYELNGRLAFEAYANKLNWVSVTSAKIPQWDYLSKEVRDGWIAAAQAVKPSVELSKDTSWMDSFDDRQRKHILWCMAYDQDEFRHGADGHNAMIIISKMADRLVSSNEVIARLLQDTQDLANQLRDIQVAKKVK